MTEFPGEKSILCTIKKKLQQWLVCQQRIFAKHCHNHKYHKKVRIEENEAKKYTFGPRESSTLGELGERELVGWIDVLFDRGYPPEWGDVHAVALSIAKWQGHSNVRASNG